MRIITTISSLAALGFIAVTMSHCGSSNSNSEIQSYDSGVVASPTAKHEAFKYVEATEDDLDQSVLDDKSTVKGMRVVTVYVTGGRDDDCAKWTLKMAGLGIAIAESADLDVKAQKPLNDSVEGTVSAKPKSYGARAGLRVVIADGETVNISGTQTFCDGGEDSEFDFDMLAKKQKLKAGFEADDTNANAPKIQTRVSGLKK